jgi:hypothetical protein
VAVRQLRSTVNYGHRSTLLSCTELQERCGGPRQGPELPRCFAAQRPVGDHTPMEKVDGGYLVTASLPETDALADRFADKWVRERLRELASVGVDQPKVTHLGTDPESRAPCRCRKRPSDPVYDLSQRRTAAAVRHMFWPNRPLQGARHQRSRESPGRPTTVSRSTSVAAINRSANASALPAARRGCGKCLCIGSSTSMPALSPAVRRGG